jgi:small-conductance mechanosensitive channel
MILHDLCSVRDASTKKTKALILDAIASRGQMYEDLLRMIFDKDVRFFVDTGKLQGMFSSVAMITNLKLDEDLNEELLELLTMLSSEELRGDAGVLKCATFSHQLRSKAELDMFVNILENKTRLNIGATDINKYCTNFTIEQFEVMYAQRMDKIKVINPLALYIIQPKIDGNRCIGRIEEEIRLLSRKGKEQTGIEWLKEELKRVSRHVVLDGEIEVGGSLETTGSVRRKSEQALDAVYTIFGAYDINQWISKKHVDKYEDCFERAKYVVDEIGSSHVNLIESYYVNAKDEDDFYDTIEMYKQKFIDQGYEGAVLKTVDHLYQPSAGSKRSTDWIKLKPQESTEGIIVDILEGEGEHEGLVGKFLVKWGGFTFEVSPGKIKHDERRFIFNSKTNYIGMRLEFVYQQLNAYGKPRDTHAIKIRQD